MAQFDVSKEFRGSTFRTDLDRWTPQKIAPRNFLCFHGRSRNDRSQEILVKQSSEHGYRTYGSTFCQPIVEV